MAASRLGSTFAPYAPPPDERHASPSQASLSYPRLQRPAQGSRFPGASSYQSGGIPSFGNAAGGGGGLGAAEEGEAQTAAQMWETRFGWRVDVCAAIAYLGGPLAALLLLILETSNDFIRFHAYQSALLTTPFLLIRILASFIFPSWIQTILTLLLLGTEIYMALRAYRDASVDLFRYELPYIGAIADRWVTEE